MITIYPGKTQGVCAGPLSQSEQRIALIAAALTKTGVRGAGGLQPMLAGLAAMGALFRQENGTVVFTQAPARGDAVVPCDAHTLPLLLPLGMVLGGRWVFECGQAAAARFGEAAQGLLRSAGISCTVSRARIEAAGEPAAGTAETGNESLAAGMLAAMTAAPGLRLSCTSCESAAAFTAQVVGRFGFAVSDEPPYAVERIKDIPNDAVYTACADAAVAAYLLLAGALGGGAGITGLVADCAQPQMRMIEDLARLGLPVRVLDGAVFSRSSRLSGKTLDAREYERILPAVIAALALARGSSEITHMDALEKQDREELHAAVEALRGLGAEILQIGGSLHLHGKRKLAGGDANCGGCAAAAMAAAAAAQRCETPVRLHDTGEIAGFMEGLRQLGLLVQTGHE